MYKVVSIFSGCGGLDLGFKEHGFDLIYACDHDPAAVACYAENVDHRVFQRDVRSLEFQRDIARLSKSDVVLGGFPCQGFSKAGPKRIGDDRNWLYQQMRDAIASLRPRLFIAENVDGLSQNFNGAIRDRILSEFSQLGYAVDYRILDAAAFGVAQRRRRIFFVGVSRTESQAFPWPHATHHTEARNGEFKVVPLLPLFNESSTADQPLRRAVTIEDAIADLRQLNPAIPDHTVSRSWPKKYAHIFQAIGEGQKLCNVRHAPTSVYTWDIPEVFGQVTSRERHILLTIAQHRRHKKYGSIPNGNPLPSEEIARLSGLGDVMEDLHRLLSKGYLKSVDGKFDLKGAMFCSGLFKRPRWSEPAPTVLTNFHNPRYFLHPLEDRPFSLRECARLQGFSDDFLFTSDRVDVVSGYRLVGNAVPPPLSRLLAIAAISFLSSQRMEKAVLA